jgi:hypothetical protein
MTKTYRILKHSETKLVARGRVLADGTLRMTDRETPVVLAEECAKRGLDLKKVQAAAAPIECLARLGINPGGVEVIADDDYQARESAKREAAISPADRDYRDIVGAAERELARAETSNYHDPARIIRARAALVRAHAEWATKHPSAAEARSAKARAEREAHEAEIRSRPACVAALEGRD